MAETTQSKPAESQLARLNVEDTGEFANLLDTGRFEHMWRVSQMFAQSQLVPAHFVGKPSDCFVACQMAIRLKVDPMMFMQNTYIVHGRPGMQAQLAIALINSSGLFEGGLEYEIEGTDPKKEGYRVRAFAVRKLGGKRVDGPWIDWAVVKAERWDGKDGSKWRTIPGLMFQYRAASWFGRLYCPERLMGMQTTDEIEDSGPQSRPVSSVVVEPIADLNKRITKRVTPKIIEQKETDEREHPKQIEPEPAGGEDEGQPQVETKEPSENTSGKPTDVPAPVRQQPPAGGQQSAGPANGPDITNIGGFDEEAIRIGATMKFSAEQVRQITRKWRLANAWVAASFGTKCPLETKQAWLEAFEAGQVDPDTGKIIPQE